MLIDEQKPLEDMWQLYRTHLHGYDPDAEEELEAAFKSGAWTMMMVFKQVDKQSAQNEYDALKAKRKEKD